MSNYIALTGRHEISFTLDTWRRWDLKRYALLFDKIGIKDLHYIEKTKSDVPELLSKLDELAWLEDENIIFEPQLNLNQHILLNSSEEYRKLFLSLVENHSQSANAIFEQFYELRDNGHFSTDIIDLIEGFHLESENISLRMICIELARNTNNSVVSLMSYTDYLSKNSLCTNNDVVHIVIQELPVPDDTTPWETIIEYRNDPDTRHSLLALRRWMRKILSSGTSASEIAEELEFLIHEFQRYMKLHDIKASTETLESIIKAPLEVVEDMIKLKFSKLAEPLFAIKKRQLMLMEAELNAPGKDIAYILKSKKAFDSM